jgi:predicted aminopeptidase
MKPSARFVRRTLLAAGSLLLLLQVEGCYYLQAIRGHSDLMSRRRPMGDVIADAASPADLKQRLALVVEARDFAVTDLLLPDNDSYRSYADLERDYVVWNVFAAPEFALAPKTWCYPVAGCVAYRGYFDQASARRLAEKLGDKGFDVAVGGVSAYSTLGRFSDPVLNTMMRWSDIELVSTIFHELAHQKLYVKGDSAFNESFATAVAEIGLGRWLADRDESDRLAAHDDRMKLRRSMMELVAPARDALATLYNQDIDVQTMREKKADILNELSVRAAVLVDANELATNNWLAAPLNNARLVSLNLYEGRLNAFGALIENCRQELACFYARAEELAGLSRDERSARLDELGDQFAVTTSD